MNNVSLIGIDIRSWSLFTVGGVNMSGITFLSHIPVDLAAHSGEVREAAPERASRFTPSTSPGEAATLGMMMA